MFRDKCVSKYTLIQRLWRCSVVLALHVMFYRLKKTSLVARETCKNHLIIFIKFFNENENNDVKMMFSSNFKNHVEIAISVQIIAIRYFSESCSPSFYPKQHVLFCLISIFHDLVMQVSSSMDALV